MDHLSSITFSNKSSLGTRPGYMIQTWRPVEELLVMPNIVRDVTWLLTNLIIPIGEWGKGLRYITPGPVTR